MESFALKPEKFSKRFPFGGGSVRFFLLCSKRIRAARVQNETAPEKLLNRNEKWFEKREKGSEKRSETRLKNF